MGDDATSEAPGEAPRDMLVGDLSTFVIGVAMEVHSRLGPGLLERMYADALGIALAARGVRVEVEVPVAVHYGHHRLPLDYRLDMLVERKLVVEVKAVRKLTDLHESQVRTYLRITRCTLGLLLNFDVDHMRDGFRRVSPRR